MKKNLFVLLAGGMIVCLSAVCGQAANTGGLVGYWPFDGDLKDKSGFGHDATGVSGPTFVTGVKGQAVLLDADVDANGQYLTVDKAEAVQVPWTACVWVRRHKDAVNYLASGLLDGGQGGPQWCGVRLEGYNAQHKVGFCEYVGNHNWNWDYLTPIDEWVHLLIIGTNDGVTLYANGVRIGTITAAAGWPVWIDWIGKTHQYNCPVDADLDELGIWNRALTDQEVVAVYKGGPLATDPKKASLLGPGDGQTDVPRDLTFSWTPGIYAGSHDVYLGTALADVNDATRANGHGVLVNQGQTAATYNPGRLAFGQTYYWRVDEVNATPDGSIFKGTVWSFTVEPKAYPVDGKTILATASSADTNQGPENTINGAGLTGDLHSNTLTDMWLTASGAAGPAWIQYEFNKVLRLDSVWIWNQNGLLEPILGLGSKQVKLEYSVNGTDYTTLGTTYDLARGTGKNDYAHNTTIDLQGIAAKYIKLTINSNWGGILPQYGLGEVRFFSVPVFAREPSPTAKATGVDVDTLLSWRAGREAGQHQVFLGTDPNHLSQAATVQTSLYAPALNLDTTYYWQVVEANQAKTPSTWPGDVWSFKTEQYVVVDDFESYTDDMDAGQAIFQAWLDGYGTTTNGSQVGNDLSPFAERTVVNSGKQSMPLRYDNTGATNSETTRTFNSPQAWSQHGIKGLTLRFYGDANNVPQQMYVKINNSKVSYGGASADLLRKQWQMWYIDLTGMNVTSVTKLSLGFDRLSGVGGKGKVFIDDIRLYSYDRSLVTPVDPGTTGLQVQYQFEGNAADSSGKGRNGSLKGAPTFVAGKIGQAISLNGTADYVNVDGYKGIVADAAGAQQPFTLSAWIKTATNSRDIIAWGTNTGGQRMNFRVDTVLRVENGSGNMRGTNGPSLIDNEWHHVAATVPLGGMLSDTRLYVDGADVSAPASATAPYALKANVDVAIGQGGTQSGRFFQGLIDEVRMYDRVLSAAEIASLAGRTIPFDKPF